MSSKTEKRAKEILRVLLTRGETSVEALTHTFATSQASIRRDLARLQKRGLVHRTHGGAILADQTYEPFRFDASFTEREKRFGKEKQDIALAAADLIEKGETVGFSAGTTTTQIARLLRSRNDLKIVTNAVNIALELSANPSLRTTLTGGSMNWPGAFSLVGTSAIETLATVLFDKLFLGVCGIDPIYGATTIEPEEAAVFRAMSRRAKQVIVVADSSKVGMSSPAVCCPIAHVDLLITDDGISEDALKAFHAVGVDVIIA